LASKKDSDFSLFVSADDTYLDDYEAGLKFQILRLIDLIEKDPDLVNRLLEEF